MEASGVAKHHNVEDAAPSKGLSSPKHHCAERRDPRLWCMDSVITREECGISALFLQLLFEQIISELRFFKINTHNHKDNRWGGTASTPLEAGRK